MDFHKLCSASGRFVKNRIDNFDSRITRLVYGIYKRLVMSEHFIVTCVMHSSV